ncbi:MULTISPECIES: hypothetical protein [Bacillus]|uniref:hypothetical protein n=1 Tax=Bacillus TaxID=1386 RepID=UPI001456E6BE|nr:MULTISPECIES: hypothetical protein [Bacillus]MDA2035852.1 hypothetical protein [Bacillus cereus]MDA2052360.1 hypothetical protein [Bacillus cereus]MEB5651189.1 hypothetical protein [Bacillus anthracis]
MKINQDLNGKIEQFPHDLAYLAKLLMKELETGTKSNTQIESLIRDEIREIVLEDEK